MSQNTQTPPRIYLEPLTVDKHLADFHAIWSDPANLIWTTETRTKSVDEIREWMIPRAHGHGPDVESYAVMLAAAGQAPCCIGSCGVRPVESLLMLGYGLKRKYWGEGYMSEAVAMFLPLYWARKAGVERLHAMVNPENVASVRILVKNGFAELEVLPRDDDLRRKGLRGAVLYKLDRPP